MDKKDKLISYRKSGNAIMAVVSDTILSRGGSLGMVISLPENKKLFNSKTDLLFNIKVGGKKYLKKCY